jgi:hypothetical protein
MSILSVISVLVGSALGVLKFILLSALRAGRWVWDKAHLH